MHGNLKKITSSYRFILRFIGSLLLILTGITQGFSQKSTGGPYRLHEGKDVTVLAAGAGLSLAGLSRDPGISFRSGGDEEDGVTVRHLLGLDKAEISQTVNPANTASNWMARGAFLLPLSLMTDAEMRSDAGKLSVLYSETLLLTNGLTLLTRRFPVAQRTNAAPEVPLDEDLIPYRRLSFFAGQTSVVASLSFCTAKIWTDYHPESKWKPIVWGAAAILPAATGYLQNRASDHNFKDVAAGYALGALIGYFVPEFHKIDRSSKRKIRVSSSMVGKTPVFVFRGLL